MSTIDHNQIVNPEQVTAEAGGELETQFVHHGTTKTTTTISGSQDQPLGVPFAVNGGTTPHEFVCDWCQFETRQCA